MDSFHPGLWREPGLIPSLTVDTANAALCYLVGLACQPTNHYLIHLGRRALVRVPAEWLHEHIQQAVDQTLDLTDDWECHRLLELYCCLDDSLAHRFATWCIESADSEIAEAGQNFLDDPRGYREIVAIDSDHPLP